MIKVALQLHGNNQQLAMTVQTVINQRIANDPQIDKGIEATVEIQYEGKDQAGFSTGVARYLGLNISMMPFPAIQRVISIVYEELANHGL